MKLSTKGKYAVTAMVDLARSHAGFPITLSEIAKRQKLSVAYLEQLFVKLRRHGLVKSTRGKTGGYSLAREANTINISDILEAVGESIQTTRCTPGAVESCLGEQEKCLTHHLLHGLQTQILTYLQVVTLADVCLKRLPVFSFSFPDSAGPVVGAL